MISWIDTLSVILLVVAVAMTGLGGWMDLFGLRGVTVTREHAWNDAIFLVLVVIALQMIYKRR
jgi:hypothetical protein